MRTYKQKKLLCPYCFEFFSLRDTPFRCTSPFSRCTPIVDPILQKVWGDSRPVGKVLPASGKIVKGIICTDCANESRKRICPHCHSVLPHTIGKFNNYIIAVIGAKEAGKSHYLAILIDQIKNKVGPNLDMMLESINDETINRYRNDFYNPIFREGRIITGTVSALADNKVQRPLVYSLTLMGKDITGKKKIKDAFVIVFFDTAGEDLNDEDTMSIVNKYIYRSNGIILLIDPLQLHEVRQKLVKNVGLPNINTETGDIITRTTRLIQKGQNLQETDRISIPLAIAFSKIDALTNIVDSQSQLLFSSNHTDGFDVKDFQAVNNDMIAFLDKWGGRDLIYQVKNRYKKYGFFGVSALGCNPHDTKKIPKVLPRRVEDPFLWVLAENGIIRRIKK